jgi:hypothetical protein
MMEGCMHGPEYSTNFHLHNVPTLLVALVPVVVFAVVVWLIETWMGIVAKITITFSW